MSLNIDMKAAAAHLRGAIERTEVATDPFPHMVIVGLLPDDLYDALLARWPAESHFYTTNWTRRLEFNFAYFMRTLNEGEMRFWTAVNQVFAEANRAVQRRLAPYFGYKFGPFLGRDWAARIGSIACTPSRIQLALYRGQYDLPPHIDNIRLITNAFLYVSESDRIEPDLGTVLYRARGVMVPTNWSLRRETLEPWLDRVGTAAYGRNRCFAYLNTPLAFHGVDPTDIGERRRRLLMFGNLMADGEQERIFVPAARAGGSAGG